jgi:hypothetical protein
VVIWLSRLLFHGTATLAFALAALVWFSPSLVPAASGSETWDRLVVTFAADGVVRRTAVASAAGLLVTTFVFFRPAVLRAKAARARLRKPSNGQFAGA